jgi:hypothetical protein
MSLAIAVGCGSQAPSRRGASAGTPFCPGASDVTQAVGFAVRGLPDGPRSRCPPLARASANKKDALVALLRGPVK